MSESIVAAATPLWLAVVLGIAAASATWLGWLLAAIRPAWPRMVEGSALVAAAFAMIALSLFEVLPGALESGLSGTKAALLFTLGAAAALLVMRLGYLLAPEGNPLSRTALVVAVAIGLHNLPEGAIPVGMAMVSLDAAVITVIALAAHNVVEGLAVSAPVIASGAGRRKALVYTSIAAAGEIVGVLIAAQFAAVLHQDRIGMLLAPVAGIMIAVSAFELMPAGVRLLKAAREDGRSPAGTA